MILADMEQKNLYYDERFLKAFPLYMSSNSTVRRLFNIAFLFCVLV